jgi:hypothetical protein
MIQRGTKFIYIYLDNSDLRLADLGGIYEKKLNRWRFPYKLEQDIVTFINKYYKDMADSSDYNSSDSEWETSSEKSKSSSSKFSRSPTKSPTDKRLHRAKSMSESCSESESEDEEDKIKYRRPALTPVQLAKKQKGITKKLELLHKA